MRAPPCYVPWGLPWGLYVDVLQGDVSPRLVARHLAHRVLVRPQQRARLTRLLGRANPNRELLRLNHSDVLE